MNADSGNPQTIDMVVGSANPRTEGEKLAEMHCDARLYCDYLVFYDELGMNKGFALYYDKARITAADAIKDFKGKFDTLKKWASGYSDYKIVDIKAHATFYSVKNDHILVSPGPDNENSVLFTIGFIEGYLKKMGIREISS